MRFAIPGQKSETADYTDCRGFFWGGARIDRMTDKGVVVILREVAGSMSGFSTRIAVD